MPVLVLRLYSLLLAAAQLERSAAISTGVAALEVGVFYGSSYIMRSYNTVILIGVHRPFFNGLQSQGLSALYGETNDA